MNDEEVRDILESDIRRLKSELDATKVLLRDWYETRDNHGSARYSAALLDTGRLLRGDARWNIAR